MKKLWKRVLSLGLGFIFLAGCSNTGTSNETDQVKVVTSIYPVYEIVNEVAGDRADVSQMVGDNEEAHHYEPSAQAVASVNEADVFVYSSEEMEFWVESLLEVVENEDLQIIELASDINLEIDDESEHEHDHSDEDQDEDGHDHDHGDIDPHFWLDPVAVRESLATIVEGLSNVDPDGAEIYQENADAFSEKLEELDNAYNEAFDGATNRVFVVQHQAFGHLAHRYDLEQVSVGGLITEVEPNPQSLIDISEFINENNIPVVFYQSGENSSAAETIAKETDTEVGVLYDLESRPVDGDFGAENAYIEVMYHNLEQLQKAIK